jgi:hypothetical protein
MEFISMDNQFVLELGFLKCPGGQHENLDVEDTSVVNKLLIRFRTRESCGGSGARGIPAETAMRPKRVFQSIGPWERPYG